MPDTVRTIEEIKALLADNTTGLISPQDLRDMLVSLNDTGWGQYSDTQYTSTAFSVAANVDTALPNNKGGVIESYKPADVTTFYDGSVITGRTGDSMTITIDMSALPTSATTTLLEVWFDIGGSFGELYRRLISFPKGNGIVRPINFTVGVYSLDTWAANGASVFCRANGPVDLSNIRYVITRTHRGGRGA